MPRSERMSAAWHRSRRHERSDSNHGLGPVARVRLRGRVSRVRTCVFTLVALAHAIVAGTPRADMPPAAPTNSLADPLRPLAQADVLASVANQHPLYLAALIERDVADGRLRGAGATFDLGTFARVFGSPRGYYESTTFESGMEQFLGIWGSTLFGGYRLTDGERLPDYYGQRTQGSGELRAGLRLPLLQDGSIDARRAAILRSRLDRELADPSIRRQHLDFLRAGAVAYLNWVYAGHRLRVAEDILRVARDRQDAILKQIERGQAAKILNQENQQLVVSRELGAVRARRRLEAAALALSLFYRDTGDRPIVPPRARLPDAIPTSIAPDPDLNFEQLEAALARRPEMSQLALARRRLDVDQRTARNAMLPRLDASAEVVQPLGNTTYPDRDETELKLGLEFRMPLQRNQARGQLQETQGRLDQLDRQTVFARERILAEIRNTREAVVAAWEQAERAALNVRLARALQEVERDRFELGAADLLALQIREQAAFQARVEELDAIEQYHVARADLVTALALDLRSPPASNAPAAEPAR